MCRIIWGEVRGGNGVKKDTRWTNLVASGHQVVVVDELEERLDLRSLGNLLLRHGLGDLARVAVDAGDDAVAKFSVIVAVVESLDDHALAPGVTARENDNNLSSLENCIESFC